MQINPDISELSLKLGYEFVQPQLLVRALTHRSYGPAHYERLEFLGDSALNCIIARFLYDSYADLPEGELSRLRSNLVNQKTLVILAQHMELGKFIQLGEGERRSAGHRRPSILADAMEAIFGAVFLDGGFESAQRVVLGLYQPYMQEVDVKTLGKDAKTLLQEYLQGRKLALPRYTVISTEGEAHAQSFNVECDIAQLKLSTIGHGNSRRAAEQAAAAEAFRKLSP